MREGRFGEAQQELDAAVAAAPEDADLRKLRAEVRREHNDCAGAAEDAAEAVVLAPGDPVAKALLGVLMLDLRRAGDAVACLREAVAAEPANPAFREALAAAYEASGDPDAALATLADGIVVAPAHVGLRNAAVLHCVRRRDFGNAVSLAEDARVAGVVDACLFGLKGHALSSLGRHEEAAEAYSEALKLGPNDPYVRHLVAASGVIPSSQFAPVEYVRTVFDGYADRFERHLISLGYRTPGLIHNALVQHPAIRSGDRVGPVLDLGCGTGLVAVALSDLPIGPLLGVDLSSRMLAQAAAKHLYAELHEADLMQFLAESAECWPLILAADVLCYFGDLCQVLASVHERLAPQGWFVFSVEELIRDADGAQDNRDWALQRQGRYAHAMEYLMKTARDTGFTIRHRARESVRYEADAPVAGIFTVLERA